MWPHVQTVPPNVTNHKATPAAWNATCCRYPTCDDWDGNLTAFTSHLPKWRHNTSMFRDRPDLLGWENRGAYPGKTVFNGLPWENLRPCPKGTQDGLPCLPLP